MKRIVAMAPILLLLGCLDTGLEPQPLPIERLTPAYRGHNGGLIEPERRVVRDAAAFEDLWTRAYGPDTPLPKVDFREEIVIAVAMGGQPTGGYSIRVEEVIATGTTLAVRVRLGSPGARCVVTQATTQPTDIVKVRARSLRWSFHDHRVVQHCS